MRTVHVLLIAIDFNFRESISNLHNVEKYYKTRSCKIISWNQLFSNFFNKHVDFTEKNVNFLPRKNRDIWNLIWRKNQNFFCQIKVTKELISRNYFSVMWSRFLVLFPHCGTEELISRKKSKREFFIFFSFSNCVKKLKPNSFREKRNFPRIHLRLSNQLNSRNFCISWLWILYSQCGNYRNSSLTFFWQKFESNGFTKELFTQKVYFLVKEKFSFFFQFTVCKYHKFYYRCFSQKIREMNVFTHKS